MAATRPFYELGRFYPPAARGPPSLAWLRTAAAQEGLHETLLADWAADSELQSFWVGTHCPGLLAYRSSAGGLGGRRWVQGLGVEGLGFSRVQQPCRAGAGMAAAPRLRQQPCAGSCWRAGWQAPRCSPTGCAPAAAWARTHPGLRGCCLSLHTTLPAACTFHQAAVLLGGHPLPWPACLPRCCREVLRHAKRLDTQLQPSWAGACVAAAAHLHRLPLNPKP